MALSAPVPQLSWRHPPAATRDYLGYLLASQRSVVVPMMAEILAREGAQTRDGVLRQAEQLAPAEWLARLSQWSGSPNLHPDTPSGLDRLTADSDHANAASPVESLAETRWAQATLDAALPGWEEQLAARTRPLRELWQARGPGFLRQLLRQLPPPDSRTPPSLGGESPVWPVLAVHPLSGGHGLLLPDQQTLLLEAMLTDADDRLPEILRLAWLVVQRALAESPAADALPAPNFTGPGVTGPGVTGPSNDRPTARPLAALLLTLQLANDLEWMPVTPAHFGLALRSWAVASNDRLPLLEERFRGWWTASDTAPDWASVRRFLDGLVEDGRLHD
jgi:hypothetical protein